MEYDVRVGRRRPQQEGQELAELANLVKGFLEAEGYEVTTKDLGLLVGRRASIGEDYEFMYVWVADSQDVRNRERSYLTSFGQSGQVHPSAQRFLVVPTTEGLRADFRQAARQFFAVKIVVPVQFFDTSFRWDASSAGASAAIEPEPAKAENDAASEDKGDRAAKRGATKAAAAR